MFPQLFIVSLICIGNVIAGLDLDMNYHKIDERIHRSSANFDFPQTSLFSRFLDKCQQSFQTNSLIVHVLNFFNQRLVGRIKSKEAWLQGIFNGFY